MLSVPEMLPTLEAFRFMSSIASFMVSLENVSRILGSAPLWSRRRYGLMNLLSNLLNLRAKAEAT